MLPNGAKHCHVTLLRLIRPVAETSSMEICRRSSHAAVVKQGLNEVISIRTTLIGLYSSLLDGQSVLQLYNESMSKDMILYSATISALSKTGRPSESLNVFRQMLLCVMKPNFVVIMAALSACGFLKSLLLCRELHGFGIKNFREEIDLQNSLINVYARCCRFDVSIMIFNIMEAKDIVSWNSVISRCSEWGSHGETLILFLRMMRSEIKPEVNHLLIALEACLKSNELGFLMGIHGYIVKSQLFSSPLLVTTLLKVYAEFNSIDAARALFKDLQYRDVVAWSAMISAYARSKYPHQAIEIFKNMKPENEEPNEITFVGLLQACSSTSDAKNGRSIHARVLKLTIDSNQFLCSSLIDLYCKLGMLKQGKTIFEVLKDKDLVSWSSMIKGYGINGRGEESIKTFVDMLEQGLKPNGIIFISLLSACTHCGLVDQGLFWFKRMDSMYDVKPELAHYSCIVDMLSRHGRIKEALGVIKKMPMKPDASIWGAIFAGCGEDARGLKIAEEVARWILTLDPGNSSCQVALSNLYAKLGQWRDVERIRVSLGEKAGWRKTIGYSLSPL